MVTPDGTKLLYPKQGGMGSGIPAHPRRRAQLNSRLELRDFLRETFVEPTFRNSEQLLLEA